MNADWPVAEVVLVDHLTHDADPRTDVFIQWKGTDACIDFRCECGFDAHFDGLFAYQIECPGCHALWAMPCNVYPVRLTERLPSAHVAADDKGWTLDEDD